MLTTQVEVAGITNCLENRIGLELFFSLYLAVFTHPLDHIPDLQRFFSRQLFQVGQQLEQARLSWDVARYKVRVFEALGGAA